MTEKSIKVIRDLIRNECKSHSERIEFMKQAQREMKNEIFEKSVEDWDNNVQENYYR